MGSRWTLIGCDWPLQIQNCLQLRIPSGTELSVKCINREQTIEFRAVPIACYDHMIIWQSTMYLNCAGQLSWISIKCQQSFLETPLWPSELMLWVVSAQFKLLFLFLDLNEQKRLVLLVLKHNTQFLSSLLSYFILSYPELVNHSRDTCFKCGQCAYEPNS